MTKFFDLMRRIDGLLIRLATLVAHGVQRWTGRTSFFLAKCGLLVWAIENLLNLFNYFSPQPSLPRADRADVSVALMVLTGVIMRVHFLDRADDALRHGSEALPTWVLMARQGSAWGVRILLVALTLAFVAKMVDEWTKPLAVIRVLGDCGVGGWTAFEYFVLVDPLPPGVSKVREFFSRFVARPVPS
jgi:hypothetical protein